MKFEAQLEYVTGYLRSGQLVGNLTDEQYQEWLTLDPKEQQEMLWDAGSVVVTDYRIDGVGDCYDIKWGSDEVL